MFSAKALQYFLDNDHFMSLATVLFLQLLRSGAHVLDSSPLPARTGRKSEYGII